MNLLMPDDVGRQYHSGSQRARVITEFWGESNLYCPSCSSSKLTRLTNNTKAIDFTCPECGLSYQLKCQCRVGSVVADGGYKAMMTALISDQIPSFYFMEYEITNWRVRNLLLVPYFAFPPSAVIKRKPLGPNARRAGWVGCNIALDRIPTEARIAVVDRGSVVSEGTVRQQYRRVKPLRDLPVAQRGWTLEVLNAVRSLKTLTFSTEEAYSLIPRLQALHPQNRHVREKLRQQLQVLRDTRFLIHTSRGNWRLANPDFISPETHG